MEKRHWIETLDGRLLDQAEFTAYNLVSRMTDGDLEIVGYPNPLSKSCVNIATFQSNVLANVVWDKFKGNIVLGKPFIDMAELKEKCEQDEN